MLNILFFVIITGIVGYFEVYKFHVYTFRDYLVWPDPLTQDYDKSMLVESYFANAGGSERFPLQTQLAKDWTYFIIYNHPDFEEKGYNGSMWTKKNLIAIRESERPIKES